MPLPSNVVDAAEDHQGGTWVRRYITTLAVLLSLAACGDESATSKATADATEGAATSVAAGTAPVQLGTLREAGFGQEGQYVWATAIVHNNSTYVGQTVTVNFNVLDAKGNLLKSQSQVESFSQPEADHIIGTQILLDEGGKAGTVEASLDVEASGAFSDQPFPNIRTTNYKVDKDDFGANRVTFEMANPLPQALKSPRIGIACRNSNGEIIGGGSSYPNLVPASGRIKVEAMVLVSTLPAKCSAFVGAPSDWKGAETTSTRSNTQSSTNAAGTADAPTAAAAFKAWMDQFTAKEWDAQYATLLSAQQKLISQKQYRTCRSISTPTIKWVKVLSVQDTGLTPVPGTKLKLPSTKVTAQVSANGIKVPADAHMFLENGQWKWIMTQENLDGCKA